MARQTTTKALRLVRVSYGKKNTPDELKEYQLANLSDSPVGTLSEWKDFAKKNGYDALDVVEKKYVITAEEINKFAEVNNESE